MTRAHAHAQIVSLLDSKVVQKLPFDKPVALATDLESKVLVASSTEVLFAHSVH